jgi:hypothetical protein
MARLSWEDRMTIQSLANENSRTAGSSMAAYSYC